MRLRKLLIPVLGLFMITLTGCITGGPMDLPPPPSDGGGGTAADIYGEVVDVDTRAQEIRVESTLSSSVVTRLRGQDDRIAFSYTSATQVTYQGRNYRPQDLEPGDLVAVYLDPGTTRVADRIVVEESVQDRGMADASNWIQGEVEGVERRSQVLRVRTDRGVERIGYQDRTPVYYEGEEYRVEQLEAGDIVKVEVDRSTYGVEAQRVEVVQSVQDRDDRDPYPETPRAGSYSGTVSWVDTRSGQFGLDVQGGDLLRVSLPFNADTRTRDTFQRLRRGSRVRIEAVPIDGGALELVRFR